MRKGLGDLVNQGLDDFKNVLLGELDSFCTEGVCYLDSKFAFGDGGHGWEKME
jgi:hypothetical protein